MTFNRCILLVLSYSLLASCNPSPKELADAQMKAIIQRENEQADNPDNIFNPKARMVFLDSVLKSVDAYTMLRVNYQRAKVFMQLGDINKTIELFRQIESDPSVTNSDFDLER